MACVRPMAKHFSYALNYVEAEIGIKHTADHHQSDYPENNRYHQSEVK